MSTMVTLQVSQEDDTFRAFAQGDEHRGETTHSTRLNGATVLVSHGVTIALRSEGEVVFDAMPHAEGCPVVCRIVAHMGRAGVFAMEHYADDEVSYLDHAAFVALAGRLGAEN